MPIRHPLARCFRLRSLTILATVALLTGGANAELLAAPGSPTADPTTMSQNVDWMSSDMAQSLDLGFSVLVPSYIPGPFGGAPSVSASGGYYSLYWQLGGGSPTFLQISGTVGGGLPAGSPADLNNELFINANVQGYEAINDVTSIYDSVWWIAGGVLYQVEGLNVDIGSLSLANSLVTLVPPAPAPDPTVEPTEPPPAEPETGPSDPETDPEQDVDEDPDQETDPDTTEEDTTDTETPAADDAESDDPADEAAAEETVEAEDEVDAPSSLGLILSAPTSVVSGGSATISINGAEASDLVTSDGTFADTGGSGIVDVQDGAVVWQAPTVDAETVVTIQLLVSQTGEEVDVLEITVRPLTDEDLDEDSDGTQGAVSPILGGDGTGGPQDLTIPFDPEAEP